MEADYQAYLYAEREYEKALQQKKEIEQKLRALSQILDGLKFLRNPAMNRPVPNRLNEMGLQEAVRTILRRSSPLSLLPLDIRDTLIEAGFRTSSPNNLLIRVHTAIKRMKNELNQVLRADGRAAYRWRLPMVHSEVAEPTSDQPTPEGEQSVILVHKRLTRHQRFPGKKKSAPLRVDSYIGPYPLGKSFLVK